MADSIWAPQPASQAQPDRYQPDTHPHPYLLYPRLWLSDHPPEIPDSVLANGPLKPFRPIKISIQRDSPEAMDGGGTSGTIEFQTFHSAEKALATISTISLSINPPGDYQSPCSATPLWVRNLPDGIDEGYLFDLFRPFGPLQSIRFIVQGPRDDLLGTVKVIYLREESARQAKSTMDGTEVEGNRISVVAEITPASPQETVSTPRRTSRMSATAAPFVPRNSPIASPRTRQTCPSLPATPPRRVQEEGFNALWTSPGYRASIPLPDQLNPINGPILPVPGTNLRYSPPRDTFIDPRNLYCQNLERSIDNAALTVIFQGFGQITSAQVITDADNKSRRHGFVSFAHASEAAHALAALNGAIIRGRPMYLRLHEPRQPRKNRLARRFGVGDTSESQSDMTGTSIASQPQTPPRGPASQLTAAALAQQNRSHSSSMNFGLGRHSRVSSIDCGLLSSLTGSARQLYISESLSRKVSVAPAAQNAEKAVSDIVAALATLDLEEQHKILLDRDLLNERITDVNEGRLPAADSTNGVATALGLTGVHGSPVDDSSENVTEAKNGLATDGMPVVTQEGHLEPTLARDEADKERSQLLSAVAGVMPEGSPVEGVTDLIASLSKMERALCLFNPRHLEDKVQEAQRILAIVQGRETPTGHGSNGANATGLGNQQQPSESGGSRRQDPSVGTQTEASSFVIPLEMLAERNCREIMALVEAANETEATGHGGIHPSELPLGPVTEDSRRDADAKLQDVLKERRLVDQKQRLGDLIYHQTKVALRKSRYPCHRGYPGRITIALLEEGIPAGFGEDHEDGVKDENQPDTASGGRPEESKDEDKGTAKEETAEGASPEAAAAPSGSNAVGAGTTTEQAPPAGPSASGSGDDDSDRPIFGITPHQQLRRHLDAQQRVLQRARHLDHIRCIAQVIALYPELFTLKVVREAQKLGARPLKEEE